MLFSRGDIRYILSQSDAGVQPVQILNDLYRCGFPRWLELATIEKCLRDNGRKISNNHVPSNAAHGHGHQSHGAGHASSSSASTNHVALGPSTANQQARQVSTHPAVQKPTTGALYDPGPTMSWDAQADRFTMSAHRYGKSAAEIWATLRRNGYDVAQTEVIASLAIQGVSTAY